MFKISEFSKLGQVSVKTLRYYDQIGLLKPAHTDPDTGYRYYTSNQLCSLNRIFAFKELGFTLQQITQLMNDDISTEQIRGMFRLKQAELQTLIEKEQAQLHRIENRLRQIEKEGALETTYEVAIKKVEKLQIVSLRQSISMQQTTSVFDELEQRLGKSLSSQYPKIVLWHDCEECEDAIDLEVGFMIQQKSTFSSNYTRELSESPMMATLLHRCHPSNTCSASTELGIWIEQNGFRIRENEPRREVYLHSDNDQSNYIAEVQIPIEKA